MEQAVPPATEPHFFDSPGAWRTWLAEHHASSAGLVLGLRKVATGTPPLTYQQALDEALCYGWIDGVRRSIDDTSWSIRFTPRKPRSVWSAVNLKRVAELTAEGRMQPPGQAAHDRVRPEDTQRYSNETRPERFPPPHEAAFRARPDAWAFFERQPASYRRAAIWWVISAKAETTQVRRLATLIADSAAGVHVAPLRRRVAGKPAEDS